MLHMLAFFFGAFVLCLNISHCLLNHTNIQFVQCTVRLSSFSPVDFISVRIWYTATHCHKNSSYSTTLTSVFFSLSEWLSLDVEIHRKKNRISETTPDWTCEYEKVRAKTPIFTRHTATKRECNEQCNAQRSTYVHTITARAKKTTAHRSIARITIYKYILCSAFNLIVGIAVVVAVVVVVVVVAVFVVIVIVRTFYSQRFWIVVALPRCRRRFYYYAQHIRFILLLLLFASWLDSYEMLLIRIAYFVWFFFAHCTAIYFFVWITCVRSYHSPKSFMDISMAG